MSSAASRAAAHRSASAPSAAPSAPSARTEGSSSISLGPPMPRNLDLSPSGAVVSSDLAVLTAEVRAFTAPERAASMCVPSSKNRQIRLSNFDTLMLTASGRAGAVAAGPPAA